jgi:NAD(P)-dependent dehydrogenase (short-subunit alcohol dehydrogenase family)
MRKILITGCSTGFGLDLAKRLIEDKNNLVIATMRNANSRETELHKISSENLEILSLDITDEGQRKAVVEHIKSKHNGELDVLVNNAGYGLYGALEKTSEAEIRTQMEVNFFGSAMMIKEFLPLMRDKNSNQRKKIINVSSMLGQTGMPLSASYCASKYALEGLVEGLHFELAPFNIDITTVCPGRHRTDFMKNIAWGSDQVDEGSYEVQTQNLKDLMNKFADGAEIPLSNVSKKIVTIINKKKSPARVFVGNDAKMLFTFKSIIPNNSLVNLFKGLYAKLINKKAKAIA